MSLSIKSFFPILGWIPGYSGSTLKHDLIAGLSVGIVVIPQSMAYAVLAGVPPVYGLYASVVPLLIYPIFGSSRHLAVGIMAIDCLIVSAGVGAIATPSSDEYIALVLLLAVMTGIIQICMGLLRFGFVVNLLSRPVILGFTSAAALTIVASQIRYLLGISLPSSSDLPLLVQSLFQQAGSIHLPTAALGMMSLLLLILFGRWVPRAPGALFAVLGGVLAVVVLNLDGAGVAVTGPIPSGLPRFSIPALDASHVVALIPTAVTLSLVQFMTVISLAKTFAMRHRYTIRPNRELIAAGADNFLGGLFGSVPVSASFSRSAITDLSGGKTSLANAFAAVLVLLTLLFLTPYFSRLPVSVFASIIVVAAIRLVDIRGLGYLMRTKRTDGLIALLTFLSTLLLGIETGVLTGIAASVVAIMYRVSRPRITELGRISGSDSLHDLARVPAARPIGGVLLLRIEASFSFVNAEYLRDVILQRISRSSPHVVLLDAGSVNDIDTTALSVLDELSESLADQHIVLMFGGMKESVLDVLKDSGLFDKLGPDLFFRNSDIALRSVQKMQNMPNGHPVTGGSSE